MHDVVINLSCQPVLRSPREDDELNAQQGHENEGGPHRLHVHVGLRSVRVSQLCHQDSYYVE